MKKTRDRPPNIECGNINFIRQHTTIPVPEVFDIIQPGIDPSRKSGLFIVSYIAGESLGTWINAPGRTHHPEEFNRVINFLSAGELPPGMSLQQTLVRLEELEPIVDFSDGTLLIQQLKSAINQLRSLPPPIMGPRICGLEGGLLIWGRCLGGTRKLVKPIDTVDQFYEFLLDQVGYTSRLPRLRRMLQSIKEKQHSVYFSHGDLHDDNILVKDGQLAGIIDWEFAGWYPQYWDPVNLYLCERRLKSIIRFWEHVGFLPHERFAEEMEWENALWHSTGETAIMPGLIPNDPMDAPLDDY
ncbi:hypothetical protein L218DRAFT_956506 [Marasmius fiardii PR-910]|nr:hypothetical protein L218DRAFT_956506 [Marasmius fiardii PR-910]